MAIIRAGSNTAVVSIPSVTVILNIPTHGAKGIFVTEHIISTKIFWEFDPRNFNKSLKISNISKTPKT